MSDFGNMIQSGCKGILIWYLYDEMLYNVMDMCEETGVYFAFSDKAPTNEDVIAAAKANPYFAGCAVPDQQGIGSQCAHTACVNAGYTDVRVVTGDFNMQVIDQLDEGCIDCIAGDSRASPFFGYVLIDAALNGHPIKDADGNVPWVSITIRPILSGR